MAASHYHPPLRPPADSDRPGRAALDLVRARDRLLARSRPADGGPGPGTTQTAPSASAASASDGDELARAESELSSRLRREAGRVRRSGLCSDARADEIHARAASTARQSQPNDGGGDGGKRRKRRRQAQHAGPPPSSFGMRLDPPSSSSSGGGGGAGGDVDEGLLVTAPLRLLGASSGSKGGGAGVPDGLARAALDFILAMCSSARDGGAGSASRLAGDMLRSAGVPLLDALAAGAMRCHGRMTEEGASTAVLAGTLRAAASVLAASGTDLSRSGRTADSLRDAAWLVLDRPPAPSDCPPEKLEVVRRSAVSLLAALPFAGAPDATPAEAWTVAAEEGAALLRWAVHDYFPVLSSESAGSEVRAERAGNPEARGRHERWRSAAEDAPEGFEEGGTDGRRSSSLASRVGCLTGYLVELLRMDACPSPSGAVTTALLPLDPLLDASEVLLSFPLAAEARSRGTKSRLRSVPVPDGLVSPDGAGGIAAGVAADGHRLLQAVVASCPSGARGRGRRVAGLALGCLRRAVSPALLSAVDGRTPASASSGLGAAIRRSVAMRTASVRTFRSVVAALGSGAAAAAGTSGQTSRGLVLVAGCLLEQARGDDGGGGGRDGWGTVAERVGLIEACCDALSSSLASSGGLIPTDIRGTLDSVASSCLASLLPSPPSSGPLSRAEARSSLLRLGASAACAPWGDGARSTVDGTLRAAASSLLRTDRDDGVASAASSARSVLDAMATPRSPPVLVPSREVVAATAGAGGRGTASADVLLERMDGSRLEAERRGREEEERRGRKKKKKSPSSDAPSEKKARVESEGPTPGGAGPAAAAAGPAVETPAATEPGRRAATPSDEQAATSTDVRPGGGAAGTNAGTAAPEANAAKSAAGGDGAARPAGAAGVPPEGGGADGPGAPGTGAGEDGAAGGDDPGGDGAEPRGDGGDDGGGSDEGSLGDFPDIVDGDPDEEDRV